MSENNFIGIYKEFNLLRQIKNELIILITIK